MQQIEIADEDIETGLAKLNTSKRPARAGRWAIPNDGEIRSISEFPKLA
jgi:hypothetical protein